MCYTAIILLPILFEGNVAQNIVIDDSHGKNGYHNTFFRNTAELYGLIINPGPAADSTNLIGNNISNKTFLKGNFYLSGEGNFINGNLVRDVLTPEASSEIEEFSMYYSELPAYLKEYLNKKVSYRNQAEERFQSKTFAICQHIEEEQEDTTKKDDDIKTTSIASINKDHTVTLYPNPATNGVLNISGIKQTDANVSIFNSNGQRVANFRKTEGMDISGLERGIYLVRFTDEKQDIIVKTLLIEKSL